MSLLRKEEKKTDPYLFTADSSTSMKLRYEAYVHNGSMDVRLYGYYDLCGEINSTSLGALEDIPVDIFKEALARDMFRKISADDYFNPRKWAIALVPADSEEIGLDVAKLNRFEAAVIERTKVIVAADSLYPYSSQRPKEVQARIKEVQDKVDRLRRALLGHADPEEAGE